MPDETKKGKEVPEGTDVPQDKVYKATEADAEVSGHRVPDGGGYYTCFRGHGPFLLPGGWDYFVCPTCGGVNLV